MKRYVFDIEGNDLLPDVTEIHCISIQDFDSKEAWHYGPTQIEEGLSKLQDADILIGHNIMGYDIPAIKKLHGDTWKYEGDYIDTLLVQCILDPEAGTVSLENWAKKLKLTVQKVQNEQWHTYTKLMADRCRGDVEINGYVMQYLTNLPQYNMISVSLAIEQQVAMLHAQQAWNGVRFDVLKAVDLLYELDTKIEEHRKIIIEGAPSTCMIPGVPKSRQESERRLRKDAISRDELRGATNPFKKDGSYTLATLRYFDDVPPAGWYSKIQIKPFNPNSKDEVKELLLNLGWKPTEWNFKKEKGGGFAQDAFGKRIPTSPKLTEDSYGSLPEGLGKTIAEYDMMNHRRRFLLNTKDTNKGALAAVKRRGDGRVSADAFTCGTPTSRYRHSGIVCNIPRPSSPYGDRLRELFTVEEGNWLVGVDLAGIEARMLAHYLLRGGYLNARKTADLILSPDKGNDFHSYNAKQWGVSRDIAKNGLYALLYGAGAAKLANTLGKPESMGARLKKAFFQAHPGIEGLIDDLEEAHRRNGGYIKGMDGRPLYIRGRNKLLNTLLQASAAFVFKFWMVKLGDKLHEGIRQVIAYHDELQYEVEDEEDAYSWATTCEEQALEVGRLLGIKVPIEAEAKVGKNWAETH